jgi:hypothetical protein
VLDIEGTGLEGIAFEVLDGSFLGGYALELVFFVVFVNSEPAGYGGGVEENVVEQDGSAEGQNLDDYEGFASLKFLSHASLKSQFCFI